MKIEINNQELAFVVDEVVTIVKKLAGAELEEIVESSREIETTKDTTEEKSKRSRKKRSDAGKLRKPAKQEPDPDPLEDDEDIEDTLDGGRTEEDVLADLEGEEEEEEELKPKKKLPKKEEEEEELKPKKKLPKKEKNPEKKKSSKQRSAVTREDVYAFLAGFIDTHGRKPIQALLKKLGADKLTELDEDKYAEFLERLEAFDKKNT